MASQEEQQNCDSDSEKTEPDSEFQAEVKKRKEKFYQEQVAQKNTQSPDDFDSVFNQAKNTMNPQQKPST